MYGWASSRKTDGPKTGCRISFICNSGNSPGRHRYSRRGLFRRLKEEGFAEKTLESSGPGVLWDFTGAISLQTARKPNSVLDDHSSRRNITASLQQPTRRFRLLLRGLFAWAHRADTLLPPEEERTDPCLFGLAPCGVYPAAAITGRAVRSYRTFSPLPQAAYGLAEANHQPGAVCSLLHLPSSRLEAAVPDVIRHTALRSSDFPPPLNTLRPERQRSSSRLHVQCTVSRSLTLGLCLPAGSTPSVRPVVVLGISAAQKERFVPQLRIKWDG